MMKTLDECVIALASAQLAKQDAEGLEAEAKKALLSHPEFSVARLREEFKELVTVQVNEPVSRPVGLDYLAGLFPEMTATGWADVIERAKVNPDLNDNHKHDFVNIFGDYAELSLTKEARTWCIETQSGFNRFMLAPKYFECTLTHEWQGKVCEALEREGRGAEAAKFMPLDSKPTIILKRKAR